MSDSIFHIFSDERFLDLTVYQYGYEKCEPLHSYGPFVRNHYLFHYIISGKGMLSVTEKDDNAVYHMEAHSGFLIEPGRINLYSADQKFPWEYVWVEFDGLRAKELMEEAVLSNDHPVFHPISDTAADKLRDEMLRLTQYPDNSRPLGIIGQLYLCNLDRSYFGKVFKDMIGQSPQDFLIRYRMSKATSLLTSTSLSIGDISVQVGYPNQLHFSRAFRNIYGMSPRQYRQQNKLLS